MILCTTHRRNVVTKLRFSKNNYYIQVDIVEIIRRVVGHRNSNIDLIHIFKFRDLDRRGDIYKEKSEWAMAVPKLKTLHGRKVIGKIQQQQLSVVSLETIWITIVHPNADHSSNNPINFYSMGIFTALGELSTWVFVVLYFRRWKQYTSYYDIFI